MTNEVLLVFLNTPLVSVFRQLRRELSLLLALFDSNQLLGEVRPHRSLGGSSGINVAAAVRVAKRPGHVIVTSLCDDGARCQSRLFNREWLEEKGLHQPER